MRSHSSRAFVTEGLKQPTQTRCGRHPRVPIWPCSKRGLPSHEVLPPVRCALTAPFHPYRRHAGKAQLGGGGLLSAALSVSSRFPGVTWRPVLWSPDFPPATRGLRPAAGGCVASSRRGCANGSMKSMASRGHQRRDLARPVRGAGGKMKSTARARRLSARLREPLNKSRKPRGV